MRPDTEAQREAAIDFQRELNERQEKRDEEGMCLYCGERPQNPELPKKFCTDCWEEGPYSCNKSGCIAEPDVTIRGQDICSSHAVQVAHVAYWEYLEKKATLEDMREDFERVSEEVGYDPRTDGRLDKDSPDNADDVVELFHNIKIMESEVDKSKCIVQRVMDHVDRVFPENYNPSL